MDDAVSERLTGIDVNKYIDEIQEEIEKTLKEVGPGRTKEEVEEGIKRLYSKLVGLSSRMIGEIGVTEDYNIMYLMTSGIIALSWTEFILKAKSLHSKRSIVERTVLKSLLDAIESALPSLFRNAVRYGEIYDKNSDIPPTDQKATTKQDNQ